MAGKVGLAKIVVGIVLVIGSLKFLIVLAWALAIFKYVPDPYIYYNSHEYRQTPLHLNYNPFDHDHYGHNHYGYDRNGQGHYGFDKNSYGHYGFDRIGTDYGSLVNLKVEKESKYENMINSIWKVFKLPTLK